MTTTQDLPDNDLLINNGFQITWQGGSGTASQAKTVTYPNSFTTFCGGVYSRMSGSTQTNNLQFFARGGWGLSSVEIYFINATGFFLVVFGV